MKWLKLWVWALVATGFAGEDARAQSAATVTIQAGQPGAGVSSNLFGIFFEEINYAGEGGIYAEMVRNRSFYNSANPDFWTLITSGAATGTIVVDTTRPLNPNQPNSLKLTLASGTGNVGAANHGFWGMAIQGGASYTLNFYAAAAAGFSGPLTARLQSTNGSRIYAQSSFSGLTTNWHNFTAVLSATASDTNAELVLSLASPGTVWLASVSLFPKQTYNYDANGLRSDLGGMLAALHPSFYRYPGGNFIEANNLTNALRWKNTIGPVAQRPGHNNDAWGYWSTDGFGLDEYLQFCADLGMAPLYDINAGLALGYNGATNNTVPLDQMGPWVQDALDLVEYVNGDTSTYWGAQRAANGHPAPYNLQYLEIGNENGGTYYNDRFALFYDALKASYPALHLITPNWGGLPTSRPVEIADEHYYASPATFISYATKYDSYSRAGPKVFVGEYAVTTGYGNYGNLAAALGEAAFMTGMERNSDLVLMASYAPLFANVNGIQWHPDLIYYDSSRGLFGTPSYYVQELFGQNRGDTVLPAAVVITTNANLAPHGAFGLGSWNTSVQYTNIVVTSNAVALYQSDFVNQGTTGWNVFNGTWSAAAGLYQQTAQITDCYSTTGSTNWANYTLTLQARKTAGTEGFLVLFNYLDDNNFTWWNIGGWSNTADGLEQTVGGVKTTYARVNQTIAANTWYYIKIVVAASRAQCYLGTNALQMATNLVQDVTLPAATSALLASATYSHTAGQVIIKAVNPYSTSLATTFNLSGLNNLGPNGTLIRLTSGSAGDENSLAAPTYVFPTTNTLANVSSNLTLTLPANSLSILRLNATGLNSYTALQLQLPATLNRGQLASATVYGLLTGNWSNLTANASHALTFTSANTNLALVDSAGNITAVGSGTVAISVSYPSLSLTVTQTVQVVAAPVAVVHRYSFTETSGLILADSVGGSAWNGTLPNGGTLGGGQLALAAAAKQYFQLPPGILSNYATVTIDAWATFPDQLPANCFLFGFGTYSGAVGYNYIFCAPQSGRIAITPANYAGEQNAYGHADFSFHTNFHITAVFNPPGGWLALYTNGALAGINNAVTASFTSVSNLYSWIGRSLYSPDPYPDFSLDEFRIYNGALSATEIAATQALGPGQLLSTASPVMSATLTSNRLTLAWPLANAGFTLLTSTNLASGNWTLAPVAQIVGNQWQVTLPLANTRQFFQLFK